MKPRYYWIELVSSMEQIIGTALSAIIGIMLPMIQMVIHPEMSSLMQGIIGAMGLIGIGIGSIIIGKLADAHGYLVWFRLCPVLIILGSGVCLFFTSIPFLIIGLFIIGLGVGGGYSLDSAYISELMPEKWRALMVGVAKATCSIGFILAAALALWILKCHPTPHIWHYLILIVMGLGIIALIMRVHWAESPKWLIDRGQYAQAKKAAQVILGSEASQFIAEQKQPADANASAKEAAAPATWLDMFKGRNLTKVIFSGIPWACEGLGVYGFGVFLPALVMALGIGSESMHGMPKIIESVETTTVVNCFILVGFVVGLAVLHRFNHVKMLYWGFLGSAAGLALLLWAHLAHLPAWVMIIGFLLYEVSLNAGPHLITYIIPTAIYPVADRGAGSGIAALLGKAGAVGGVILMPVLLEAGGMKLVLIVSISVMVAGALIALVCGRILGLMPTTRPQP